jgi:vitamin B12 transporter
VDTEVTDAGFDTGGGAYFVEGETLLRRPAHTFAVRAAGTVAERGRLHTRVSYFGTRADRTFDPVTFAPSRLELPSYVLWTLGADWRVLDAAPRRPSLTISIRAENLLDEGYQEVYGYDAPGRQVYLGLSMGVGS